MYKIRCYKAHLYTEEENYFNDLHMVCKLMLL